MKVLVIFAIASIIMLSGLVRPVSSQMMCAGGDEAFHFTVSDIVLIGTVTEINPSTNTDRYDYITFDVKYPLKGLGNVTDFTVATYQGGSYSYDFKINSEYLVHANERKGVEYFTDLCSANQLLKTEKDVEDMKNKLLEINTPPPLKQKQYGLALHAIKCKQNLVLVQKYDGTPACVTESTKTTLIERGWTETSSSQIRNPVSVPTGADPISITINGSTSLVIPINAGETKEIDILLEPKIPIVSSTVSVESYFGAAGDCNEIDTTSYCPGRGIYMILSDTTITSQKEITLTIKVPDNTTGGTYSYKIATETLFESPDDGKSRTVGNSIRFDLKVENEN